MGGFPRIRWTIFDPSIKLHNPRLSSGSLGLHPLVLVCIVLFSSCCAAPEVTVEADNGFEVSAQYYSPLVFGAILWTVYMLLSMLHGTHWSRFFRFVVIGLVWALLSLLIVPKSVVLNPAFAEIVVGCSDVDEMDSCRLQFQQIVHGFVFLSMLIMSTLNLLAIPLGFSYCSTILSGLLAFVTCDHAADGFFMLLLHSTQCLLLVRGSKNDRMFFPFALFGSYGATLMMQQNILDVDVYRFGQLMLTILCTVEFVVLFMGQKVEQDSEVEQRRCALKKARELYGVHCKEDEDLILTRNEDTGLLQFGFEGGFSIPEHRRTGRKDYSGVGIRRSKDSSDSTSSSDSESLCDRSEVKDVDSGRTTFIGSKTPAAVRRKEIDERVARRKALMEQRIAVREAQRLARKQYWQKYKDDKLKHNGDHDEEDCLICHEHRKTDETQRLSVWTDNKKTSGSEDSSESIWDSVIVETSNAGPKGTVSDDSGFRDDDVSVTNSPDVEVVVEEEQSFEEDSVDPVGLTIDEQEAVDTDYKEFLKINRVIRIVLGLGMYILENSYKKEDPIVEEIVECEDSVEEEVKDIEQVQEIEKSKISPKRPPRKLASSSPVPVPRKRLVSEIPVAPPRPSRQKKLLQAKKAEICKEYNITTDNVPVEVAHIVSDSEEEVLLRDVPKEQRVSSRALRSADVKRSKVVLTAREVKLEETIVIETAKLIVVEDVVEEVKQKKVSDIKFSTELKKDNKLDKHTFAEIVIDHKIRATDDAEKVVGPQRQAEVNEQKDTIDKGCLKDVEAKVASILLALNTHKEVDPEKFTSDFNRQSLRLEDLGDDLSMNNSRIRDSINAQISEGYAILEDKVNIQESGEDKCSDDPWEDPAYYDEHIDEYNRDKIGYFRTKLSDLMYAMNSTKEFMSKLDFVNGSCKDRLMKSMDYYMSNMDYCDKNISPPLGSMWKRTQTQYLDLCDMFNDKCVAGNKVIADKLQKKHELESDNRDMVVEESFSRRCADYLVKLKKYTFLGGGVRTRLSGELKGLSAMLSSMTNVPEDIYKDYMRQLLDCQNLFDEMCGRKKDFDKIDVQEDTMSPLMARCMKIEERLAKFPFVAGSVLRGFKDDVTSIVTENVKQTGDDRDAVREKCRCLMDKIRDKSTSKDYKKLLEEITANRDQLEQLTFLQGSKLKYFTDSLEKFKNFYDKYNEEWTEEDSVEFKHNISLLEDTIAVKQLNREAKPSLIDWPVLRDRINTTLEKLKTYDHLNVKNRDYMDGFYAEFTRKLTNAQKYENQHFIKNGGEDMVKQCKEIRRLIDDAPSVPVKVVTDDKVAIDNLVREIRACLETLTGYKFLSKKLYDSWTVKCDKFRVRNVTDDVDVNVLIDDLHDAIVDLYKKNDYRSKSGSDTSSGDDKKVKSNILVSDNIVNDIMLVKQYSDEVKVATSVAMVGNLNVLVDEVRKRYATKPRTGEVRKLYNLASDFSILAKIAVARLDVADGPIKSLDKTIGDYNVTAKQTVDRIEILNAKEDTNSGVCSAAELASGKLQKMCAEVSDKVYKAKNATELELSGFGVLAEAVDELSEGRVKKVLERKVDGILDLYDSKMQRFNQFESFEKMKKSVLKCDDIYDLNKLEQQWLDMVYHDSYIHRLMVHMDYILSVRRRSLTKKASKVYIDDIVAACSDPDSCTRDVVVSDERGDDSLQSQVVFSCGRAGSYAMNPSDYEDVVARQRFGIARCSTKRVMWACVAFILSGLPSASAQPLTVRAEVVIDTLRVMTVISVVIGLALLFLFFSYGFLGLILYYVHLLVGIVKKLGCSRKTTVVNSKPVLNKYKYVLGGVLVNMTMNSDIVDAMSLDVPISDFTVDVQVILYVFKSFLIFCCVVISVILIYTVFSFFCRVNFIRLIYLLKKLFRFFHYFILTLFNVVKLMFYRVKSIYVYIKWRFFRRARLYDVTPVYDVWANETNLSNSVRSGNSSVGKLLAGGIIVSEITSTEGFMIDIKDQLFVPYGVTFCFMSFMLLLIFMNLGYIVWQIIKNVRKGKISKRNHWLCVLLVCIFCLTVSSGKTVSEDKNYLEVNDNYEFIRFFNKNPSEHCYMVDSDRTTIVMLQSLYLSEKTEWFDKFEGAAHVWSLNGVAALGDLTDSSGKKGKVSDICRSNLHFIIDNSDNTENTKYNIDGKEKVLPYVRLLNAHYIVSDIHEGITETGAKVVTGLVDRINITLFMKYKPELNVSASGCTFMGKSSNCYLCPKIGMTRGHIQDKKFGGKCTAVNCQCETLHVNNRLREDIVDKYFDMKKCLDISVRYSDFRYSICDSAKGLYSNIITLTCREVDEFKQAIIIQNPQNLDGNCVIKDAKGKVDRRTISRKNSLTTSVKHSVYDLIQFVHENVGDIIKYVRDRMMSIPYFEEFSDFLISIPMAIWNAISTIFDYSVPYIGYYVDNSEVFVKTIGTEVGMDKDSLMKLMPYYVMELKKFLISGKTYGVQHLLLATKTDFMDELYGYFQNNCSALVTPYDSIMGYFTSRYYHRGIQSYNDAFMQKLTHVTKDGTVHIHFVDLMNGEDINKEAFSVLLNYGVSILFFDNDVSKYSLNSIGNSRTMILPAKFLADSVFKNCQPSRLANTLSYLCEDVAVLNNKYSDRLVSNVIYILLGILVVKKRSVLLFLLLLSSLNFVTIKADNLNVLDIFKYYRNTSVSVTKVDYNKFSRNSYGDCFNDSYSNIQQIYDTDFWETCANDYFMKHNVTDIKILSAYERWYNYNRVYKVFPVQKKFRIDTWVGKQYFSSFRGLRCLGVEYRSAWFDVVVYDASIHTYRLVFFKTTNNCFDIMLNFYLSTYGKQVINMGGQRLDLSISEGYTTVAVEYIDAMVVVPYTFDLPVVDCSLNHSAAKMTVLCGIKQKFDRLCSSNVKYWYNFSNIDSINLCENVLYRFSGITNGKIYSDFIAGYNNINVTRSYEFGTYYKHVSMKNIFHRFYNIMLSRVWFLNSTIITRKIDCDYLYNLGYNLLCGDRIYNLADSFNLGFPMRYVSPAAIVAHAWAIINILLLYCDYSELKSSRFFVKCFMIWISSLYLESVSISYVREFLMFCTRYLLVNSDIQSVSDFFLFCFMYGLFVCIPIAICVFCISSIRLEGNLTFVEFLKTKFFVLCVFFDPMMIIPICLYNSFWHRLVAIMGFIIYYLGRFCVFMRWTRFDDVLNGFVQRSVNGKISYYNRHTNVGHSLNLETLSNGLCRDKDSGLYYIAGSGTYPKPGNVYIGQYMFCDAKMRVQEVFQTGYHHSDGVSVHFDCKPGVFWHNLWASGSLIGLKCRDTKVGSKGLLVDVICATNAEFLVYLFMLMYMNFGVDRTFVTFSLVYYFILSPGFLDMYIRDDNFSQLNKRRYLNICSTRNSDSIQKMSIFHDMLVYYEAVSLGLLIFSVSLSIPFIAYISIFIVMMGRIVNSKDLLTTIMLCALQINLVWGYNFIYMVVTIVCMGMRIALFLRGFRCLTLANMLEVLRDFYISKIFWSLTAFYISGHIVMWVFIIPIISMLYFLAIILVFEIITAGEPSLVPLDLHNKYKQYVKIAYYKTNHFNSMVIAKLEELFFVEITRKIKDVMLDRDFYILKIVGKRRSVENCIAYINANVQTLDETVIVKPVTYTFIEFLNNVEIKLLSRFYCTEYGLYAVGYLSDVKERVKVLFSYESKQRYCVVQVISDKGYNRYVGVISNCFMDYIGTKLDMDKEYAHFIEYYNGTIDTGFMYYDKYNKTRIADFVNDSVLLLENYICVGMKHFSYFIIQMLLVILKHRTVFCVLVFGCLFSLVPSANAVELHIEPVVMVDSMWGFGMDHWLFYSVLGILVVISLYIFRTAKFIYGMVAVVAIIYHVLNEPVNAMVMSMGIDSIAAVQKISALLGMRADHFMNLIVIFTFCSSALVLLKYIAFLWDDLFYAIGSDSIVYLNWDFSAYIFSTSLYDWLVSKHLITYMVVMNRNIKLQQVYIAGRVYYKYILDGKKHFCKFCPVHSTFDHGFVRSYISCSSKVIAVHDDNLKHYSRYRGHICYDKKIKVDLLQNEVQQLIQDKKELLENVKSVRFDIKHVADMANFRANVQKDYINSITTFYKDSVDWPIIAKRLLDNVGIRCENYQDFSSIDDTDMDLNRYIPNPDLLATVVSRVEHGFLLSALQHMKFKMFSVADGRLYCKFRKFGMSYILDMFCPISGLIYDMGAHSKSMQVDVEFVNELNILSAILDSCQIVRGPVTHEYCSTVYLLGIDIKEYVVPVHDVKYVKAVLCRPGGYIPPVGWWEIYNQMHSVNEDCSEEEVHSGKSTPSSANSVRGRPKITLAALSAFNDSLKRLEKSNNATVKSHSDDEDDDSDESKSSAGDDKEKFAQDRPIDQACRLRSFALVQPEKKIEVGPKFGSKRYNQAHYGTRSPGSYRGRGRGSSYTSKHLMCLMVFSCLIAPTIGAIDMDVKKYIDESMVNLENKMVHTLMEGLNAGFGAMSKNIEILAAKIDNKPILTVDDKIGLLPLIDGNYDFRAVCDIVNCPQHCIEIYDGRYFLPFFHGSCDTLDALKNAIDVGWVTCVQSLSMETTYKPLFDYLAIVHGNLAEQYLSMMNRCGVEPSVVVTSTASVDNQELDLGNELTDDMQLLINARFEDGSINMKAIGRLLKVDAKCKQLYGDDIFKKMFESVENCVIQDDMIKRVDEGFNFCIQEYVVKTNFQPGLDELQVRYSNVKQYYRAFRELCGNDGRVVINSNLLDICDNLGCESICRDLLAYDVGLKLLVLDANCDDRSVVLEEYMRTYTRCFNEIVDLRDDEYTMKVVYDSKRVLDTKLGDIYAHCDTDLIGNQPNHFKLDEDVYEKLVEAKIAIISVDGDYLAMSGLSLETLAAVEQGLIQGTEELLRVMDSIKYRDLLCSTIVIEYKDKQVKLKYIDWAKSAGTATDLDVSYCKVMEPFELSYNNKLLLEADNSVDNSKFIDVDQNKHTLDEDDEEDIEHDSLLLRRIDDLSAQISKLTDIIVEKDKVINDLMNRLLNGNSISTSSKVVVSDSTMITSTVSLSYDTIVSSTDINIETSSSLDFKSEAILKVLESINDNMPVYNETVMFTKNRDDTVISTSIPVHSRTRIGSTIPVFLESVVMSSSSSSILPTSVITSNTMSSTISKTYKNLENTASYSSSILTKLGEGLDYIKVNFAHAFHTEDEDEDDEVMSYDDKRNMLRCMIAGVCLKKNKVKCSKRLGYCIVIDKDYDYLDFKDSVIFNKFNITSLDSQQIENWVYSDFYSAVGIDLDMRLDNGIGIYVEKGYESEAFIIHRWFASLGIPTDIVDCTTYKVYLGINVGCSLELDYFYSVNKTIFLEVEGLTLDSSIMFIHGILFSGRFDAVEVDIQSHYGNMFVLDPLFHYYYEIAMYNNSCNAHKDYVRKYCDTDNVILLKDSSVGNRTIYRGFNYLGIPVIAGCLGTYDCGYDNCTCDDGRMKHVSFKLKTTSSDGEHKLLYNHRKIDYNGEGFKVIGLQMPRLNISENYNSIFYSMKHLYYDYRQYDCDTIYENDTIVFNLNDIDIVIVKYDDVRYNYLSCMSKHVAVWDLNEILQQNSLLAYGYRFFIEPGIYRYIEPDGAINQQGTCEDLKTKSYTGKALKSMIELCNHDTYTVHIHTEGSYNEPKCGRKNICEGLSKLGNLLLGRWCDIIPTSNLHLRIDVQEWEDIMVDGGAVFKTIDTYDYYGHWLSIDNALNRDKKFLRRGGRITLDSKCKDQQVLSTTLIFPIDIKDIMTVVEDALVISPASKEFLVYKTNPVKLRCKWHGLAWLYDGLVTKTGNGIYSLAYKSINGTGTVVNCYAVSFMTELTGFILQVPDVKISQFLFSVSAVYVFVKYCFALYYVYFMAKHEHRYRSLFLSLVTLSGLIHVTAYFHNASALWLSESEPTICIFLADFGLTFLWLFSTPVDSLGMSLMLVCSNLRVWYIYDKYRIFGYFLGYSIVRLIVICLRQIYFTAPIFGYIMICVRTLLQIGQPWTYRHTVTPVEAVCYINWCKNSRDRYAIEYERSCELAITTDSNVIFSPLEGVMHNECKASGSTSNLIPRNFPGIDNFIPVKYGNNELIGMKYTCSSVLCPRHIIHPDVSTVESDYHNSLAKFKVGDQFFEILINGSWRRLRVVEVLMTGMMIEVIFDHVCFNSVTGLEYAKVGVAYDNAVLVYIGSKSEDLNCTISCAKINKYGVMQSETSAGYCGSPVYVRESNDSPWKLLGWHNTACRTKVYSYVLNTNVIILNGSNETFYGKIDIVDHIEVKLPFSVGDFVLCFCRLFGKYLSESQCDDAWYEFDDEQLVGTNIELAKRVRASLRDGVLTQEQFENIFLHIMSRGSDSSIVCDNRTIHVKNESVELGHNGYFFVFLNAIISYYAGVPLWLVMIYAIWDLIIMLKYGYKQYSLQLRTSLSPLWLALFSSYDFVYLRYLVFIWHLVASSFSYWYTGRVKLLVFLFNLLTNCFYAVKLPADAGPYILGLVCSTRWSEIIIKLASYCIGYKIHAEYLSVLPMGELIIRLYNTIYNLLLHGKMQLGDQTIFVGKIMETTTFFPGRVLIGSESGGLTIVLKKDKHNSINALYTNLLHVLNIIIGSSTIIPADIKRDIEEISVKMDATIEDKTRVIEKAFDAIQAALDLPGGFASEEDFVNYIGLYNETGTIMGTVLAKNLYNLIKCHNESVSNRSMLHRALYNLASSDKYNVMFTAGKWNQNLLDLLNKLKNVVLTDFRQIASDKAYALYNANSLVLDENNKQKLLDLVKAAINSYNVSLQDVISRRAVKNDLDLIDLYIRKLDVENVNKLENENIITTLFDKLPVLESTEDCQLACRVDAILIKLLYIFYRLIHFNVCVKEVHNESDFDIAGKEQEIVDLRSKIIALESSEMSKEDKKLLQSLKEELAAVKKEVNVYKQKLVAEEASRKREHHKIAVQNALAIRKKEFDEKVEDRIKYLGLLISRFVRTKYNMDTMTAADLLTVLEAARIGGLTSDLFINVFGHKKLGESLVENMRKFECKPDKHMISISGKECSNILVSRTYHIEDGDKDEVVVVSSFDKRLPIGTRILAIGTEESLNFDVKDVYDSIMLAKGGIYLIHHPSLPSVDNESENNFNFPCGLKFMCKCGKQEHSLVNSLCYDSFVRFFEQHSVGCDDCKGRLLTSKHFWCGQGNSPCAMGTPFKRVIHTHNVNCIFRNAMGCENCKEFLKSGTKFVNEAYGSVVTVPKKSYTFVRDNNSIWCVMKDGKRFELCSYDDVVKAGCEYRVLDNKYVNFIPAGLMELGVKIDIIFPYITHFFKVMRSKVHSEVKIRCKKHNLSFGSCFCDTFYDSTDKSYSVIDLYKLGKITADKVMEFYRCYCVRNLNKKCFCKYCAPNLDVDSMIGNLDAVVNDFLV